MGQVSLPPNFIRQSFPLHFRTVLGSQSREITQLIRVKLLSDYLSVCDYNPPTLQMDRQTDRRTDGQTTYGVLLSIER